MAINGGDGSIILTTKVDETGLKKGLDSMKKLGATAGKTFLAIGAAAATATVAITKMATSAYADYEQLVGGVETLFKGSAKRVMAYAENAFYTAGVSANEYMKQVTSFSAALIRSTAGDTDKAADVANMALQDISDNVNKMGSSMESVQLAYQGFARQQYLLLDNLKLGYGGTKTEMERLLRDAQTLTGVKYDINNLADVYSAIHAIQEELGITGTTAKEAEKTITGSANMMKAAWKNVLSAIAGGGDLDRAINNFVNSVSRYFQNIVPVIKTALSGVGRLIAEITPVLVENIARTLVESIPYLISAIFQTIISLGKGLWEGVKALFSGGSKDVNNGISDSLKNVISSASGAGNKIQELGDKTEKAGKQAKKSLASFDDLNILTEKAESTETQGETNGLNYASGISAEGVFGETPFNGVAEQTQEIKENSEKTLSAWQTLSYDVLGKISMEKLANVNAAFLKLKSSAETYRSTFGTDVSWSDIIAGGYNLLLEVQAGALTVGAGGLDIASGLVNKDIDKVVGGAGTMFGGIMQMLPDVFSKAWGGKEFFQPITAEIDNVFGEVDGLTAQALRDYKIMYSKASVQFKKTLLSGEIITPETASNLESQLEQAFAPATAFIDDNKAKAIESINSLVEKGMITQEEAEVLLAEADKAYADQETKIQNNRNRINEILSNASQQNRKLTKEENAEINRLLNEANSNATSIFTTGASEREKYLQNMMKESGKMDSMRLSQVIQLSNDIYNEKVSAAEEEYDQAIKDANHLYYNLGIIDEAEYKKMVEKAEENKKNMIKVAGDQRKEVVADAQKMAGEVANTVDPKTGVIYSKWELLWDDMYGKVKSVINSIIDAINGLIKGGWNLGSKFAGLLGIDVDFSKIPLIPRLAQGAVLPPNKPFLSIVGDQKYGTNIEAPLDTIVEAMNIALSNRGTSDTVKEEHYYLDETELMSIVYRLFKGGERLNGNSLVRGGI